MIAGFKPERDVCEHGRMGMAATLGDLIEISEQTRRLWRGGI